MASNWLKSAPVIRASWMSVAPNFNQHKPGYVLILTLAESLSAASGERVVYLLDGLKMPFCSL